MASKSSEQPTKLSLSTTSKNTLIDSEEKELFEVLDQQSNLISTALTKSKRPLSILITGGSQSGKSSLIEAFFGADVALSINGQRLSTGATSNGSPVTQDVGCYRIPASNLELIDTPGLEKNVDANIVARIQKQIQQQKLKPAIIWIVLNYFSSMENVELDLVKLVPKVPVIIVVNKCDFLQKRKKEINQDPTCLSNFDEFKDDKLPAWMAKYTKLLNIRKRLLDWKKQHDQVRRVLIMSLGDPEEYDENDDPAHEPIGLDVLLEVTWGSLDQIGRVQLAELHESSKISKINYSIAIILSAMASAGGAAWIPLPIVDSVVISSIQTTMVISLYKIWGVVGVDAKTFAIVFLKSLAPVLISFAAGYTTANVIKFFFGIGTIIGGALDTVIATGGTFLIGTLVTIYLSESVYSRHQAMTEEGLMEDIQSFMKSERFKQTVNDIKELSKNPKNISRNQIASLMERKT